MKNNDDLSSVYLYSQMEQKSIFSVTLELKSSHMFVSKYFNLMTTWK